MYCNQLAVEAAWLVSSGVMTQCQYRHLIERRSVKVLRRGYRENVALVAYESLPRRFKDKVLQLVDNPYETVKVNILSQYIEHDAVVSRWFDDYRLPDGRHLPEARRAEYYANAIVLRAVARLTEFRRAKGETDAWSGVAEAIAALDPYQFPVNLPANARRLQQKAEQYQKEGYPALISGLMGNANRQRLTPQMVRLILSIYGTKVKLFATDVLDVYKDFLIGVTDIVDCETGELINRNDFYRDGFPVIPSETSIWNIINDPKNRRLVDLRRNDTLYNKSVHTPHHVRRTPSYSLSKISMDDRDLF